MARQQALAAAHARADEDEAGEVEGLDDGRDVFGEGVVVDVVGRWGGARPVAVAVAAAVEADAVEVVLLAEREHQGLEHEGAGGPAVEEDQDGEIFGRVGRVGGLCGAVVAVEELCPVDGAGEVGHLDEVIEARKSGPKYCGSNKVWGFAGRVLGCLTKSVLVVRGGQEVW